MSTPPPGKAAHARGDRIQRVAATVATLLLHLLLVLLALWVAPLVMTSPDGASGGARIEVEYIDLPHDIPSPPEFPRQAQDSTPEPLPAPPEEQRPDSTRLQVTTVEQADLPPPSEAERPSRASPPPPGRPSPDRARRQAWGQPPGMLPDAHAPVNAAPTPSPAVYQGRRYSASPSESSLEVGGFQVIYDLVADTRLREWRDQGMTELWLPLPGVRQLMVCPLETTLRRGSGPCRVVEPDDPALEGIGDARKVISMERVYRHGEPLWLGPGPYR